MKFERFVKEFNKYKVVSIEEDGNVFGIILCRRTVDVQALIYDYFRTEDESTDFYEYLNKKIQYLPMGTNERALFTPPADMEKVKLKPADELNEMTKEVQETAPLGADENSKRIQDSDMVESDIQDAVNKELNEKVKK